MSSLANLKRIADFQTKNQACCCDIDQCDEFEAGCERVRSIVEDANHIGSGYPPICAVELISPTPAAAADSLRIIVGIDQKAGRNA